MPNIFADSRREKSRRESVDQTESMTRHVSSIPYESFWSWCNIY